jgi:hypothetical protein
MLVRHDRDDEGDAEQSKRGPPLMTRSATLIDHR